MATYRGNWEGWKQEEEEGGARHKKEQNFKIENHNLEIEKENFEVEEENVKTEEDLSTDTPFKLIKRQKNKNIRIRTHKSRKVWCSELHGQNKKLRF